MENKKSLRINCALCDVRNATEEMLSTYSEIHINAATIVTNQAAQVLLGKYNARLNCARVLSLEEDVRFSTVNGPMTISAGQSMPEEKLVVSVNGPLTLEPGCEEVLKSYVTMTVNGPVRCPESIASRLGDFAINGPIQTYPDGAILLKNTTILDRVFHLRAKQNALYYAAGRIVALSPDINFEKLTEKNVRFTTKTLLVAESMAEAAVPLFDDKTDIFVLPDGCAYVDDDVELNASLIKRYGGKLYVNGDLTIHADGAEVLDQVTFLRVNGHVLVCKSLKDRVLSMDAEYDGLYVTGSVMITERAQAEISTAMLESAADGVSVSSCAKVLIAEDVTPELLREKLVSIADCATVQCTPAQRPVIEELSRDIAHITCGDDEERKEEEAAEDENAVRINTAFYNL